MRWWWVALWMVASEALAAPLSLKAADGVAVAAETVGDGGRGVVLVPGLGRSKADLAELGGALQRAGFRVVMIDLRAPGADGSLAAATADVVAAVAWLRAKGAKDVAALGVDATGAVVLQAAAVEPGISAVAMISPKLSVPGVKVSEALAALGARPLLVVAGSNDTTGVKAGTAMTKEAGRRLRVVEGGTEGLTMLRQAADLQGALVGWFTDAGAGEAGPRTGELRAGDAGAVETTGTRIGEKP